LENQLAINGHSAVINSPLSPWPVYQPDEIAAVTKVLESGKTNYWTGNHCSEFEQKFSKLCGCDHAVAVANGTVAIELALKAIDIQIGEEVIVTARSFFASASAIVACGATPVFCDVEPESGNISANTIVPHITSKTKAIIVVHLAGWPCDMDPIIAIAEKHDIVIIEDCAQAHGASYKGKTVGSIGHIGCFSFCQDKIISTGGEGGMLVTNKENYWRKAWSYKDHGRGYDKVFHYQHPPGFRWLSEGFGTNWRLTEMQAAIGICQIDKLSEWLELRKRNADTLRQVFNNYSAFRTPVPEQEYKHSYYRLYTYINEDELKPGWSRDKIREAIRAEGLPVVDGACPEIYLENAFKDLENFRHNAPLPIAKSLGETSLMFPVHHTLSQDDLSNMCRAVQKVLDVANK